jgi:hypothetical protein
MSELSFVLHCISLAWNSLGCSKIHLSVHKLYFISQTVHCCSMGSSLLNTVFQAKTDYASFTIEERLTFEVNFDMSFFYTPKWKLQLDGKELISAVYILKIEVPLLPEFAMFPSRSVSRRRRRDGGGVSSLSPA